MIRIVVVDDHVILREGLRALLETEPEFAVIGEAGDGLEAIELASRVAPDVMLLDLSLPGLNGLDVTLRLGHVVPRTRVLILSGSADTHDVRQALHNGASGYVVKGACIDTLVQAVRCVVSGRIFLSSPFAEQGLDAFIGPRSDRNGDPCRRLTFREREVLHLAAEGLTSRQVGGRLSISPRTAEAHRANLMRKLRLCSQTELVRFAISHGIVRLG
jgi:DNA-binding NarL/FixJ family response regulator